MSDKPITLEDLNQTEALIVRVDAQSQPKSLGGEGVSAGLIAEVRKQLARGRR